MDKDKVHNNKKSFPGEPAWLKVVRKLISESKEEQGDANA